MPITTSRANGYRLALILFIFPSFGWCPPASSNSFDVYYRSSIRLFKHYQPEANPNQVLDFCKGTYYGCRGDIEILPVLAAISCMEGGFKPSKRHKNQKHVGWLGGHRVTIVAGSNILDGKGTRDWAWLKQNPVHMSACLAAQFSKLYRLYGREKAIRHWNKGMNWRCKIAGKYYNGVEKLVKEFKGEI